MLPQIIPLFYKHIHTPWNLHVPMLWYHNFTNICIFISYRRHSWTALNEKENRIYPISESNNNQNGWLPTSRPNYGDFSRGIHRQHRSDSRDWWHRPGSGVQSCLNTETTCLSPGRGSQLLENQRFLHPENCSDHRWRKFYHGSSGITNRNTRFTTQVFRID